MNDNQPAYSALPELVGAIIPPGTRTEGEGFHVYTFAPGMVAEATSRAPVPAAPDATS